MPSFDVLKFRQHFPFFSQHPDWVYLDNAATSHKPYAVLDAMQHFYQHCNSNVHRAAHQLSAEATGLYEQARADIARFVNVQSHEVIFTSGATAALNQLAYGLMHTVLQPGDRVLISSLEHHANIVPWQLHCQRHGVILDVIPLTPQLQLDVDAFEYLLKKQPKVVSVSHISNVLGHIQPLSSLLQKAKAAGAMTIVDGAQGIIWQKPDMQQLDADFYVFSGHKLYGPTGTGILCGKAYQLEKLTPLQGGGEMISSVSFSHSNFAPLPLRLEAGTPNIAGTIGLAAAINWLQQYDLAAMAAHKTLLLQQFFDGLEQIPQIKILSAKEHNAGIVAFNLQNEHPSDVAELLNQQKIAVRAGQHCAMPLFSLLGLPGAVRCSFAAYNTEADVCRALQALAETSELLSA